MNYNDFFEKAKNKNITNIQVVEKTIIDSSVEILDGEIESYDDYNNIDYNIKAEYNGKTVKLTSDYINESIIDLIITKCNITDTEYKDDYLNNGEIIEKNNTIDFNIKNEIERLIKISELRDKYPKIKKLTTCFSENYTNTRIINSNGVDISTDSHLCTYIVEAITENDGEFTSYDEKILTTNKSEINFEDFAESIINKTLIMSNKKKIDSQKYNIILDKKVASRIIASFGHMLSATAIRNKVSCLENKLDKKLFSEKLTVIEDPTNKKFPGYRLFDNEGTRTYKKDIIKKGIVKTYLYNIKEALLADTKSTANGYDSISTKNMYVIPGKLSDEELLKKLGNGIYIADYMESGGTSINSVNGNISLQVFGFIVENGKLVCGIEPSILTTTIYELLSNIEEISSDLQFTYTSFASPSMLIKEISIAR
jgi:PmbA protein